MSLDRMEWPTFRTEAEAEAFAETQPSESTDEDFEPCSGCACPACVEYFAAVPVAIDEEPTAEIPATTMRELVEATR